MGKKKQKIRPKYRCVVCKLQWETDEPLVDVCPDCGSLYYEWLNYDEWRKEHMKDGH